MPPWNNADRHLLAASAVGKLWSVTHRWPRSLKRNLARNGEKWREMARGGPWSEEARWKLLISEQKSQFCPPIVSSFDLSYKWHYKNSKRLRKPHNPVNPPNVAYLFNIHSVWLNRNEVALENHLGDTRRSLLSGANLGSLSCVHPLSKYPSFFRIIGVWGGGAGGAGAPPPNSGKQWVKFGQTVGEIRANSGWNSRKQWGKFGQSKKKKSARESYKLTPLECGWWRHTGMSKGGCLWMSKSRGVFQILGGWMTSRGQCPRGGCLWLSV